MKHTPARLLLLALSMTMTGGCSAQADATPSDPTREVPLIGMPCEGCEAAFDGLPATVPTRLVLAGADEAGERMQIDGQVTDADGSPRAGVLLYVHQTDHTGRYPAHADPAGLGRAARLHGRLRGWVCSDADGRYRIDTIRPGSYPGETIPEHVHMQVIEPGCFTYFIDDLQFRDDPKLTDRVVQRQRDLGGSGLASPEQTATGWSVRRDVVLGRNIPNHRDCSRADAAPAAD